MTNADRINGLTETETAVAHSLLAMTTGQYLTVNRRSVFRRSLECWVLTFRGNEYPCKVDEAAIDLAGEA